MATPNVSAQSTFEVFSTNYPHVHPNSPHLAVPDPSAVDLSTYSTGARGYGSTVAYVRPVPKCVAVRRFRLCEFRPPRVCWRGDDCTFPHSEEELKAWNYDRHSHLHAEPQSKVKPRQDPWPALHREPTRPVFNTPKKSSFLERSKKELQINDIQPGLTVANYKEKFHNLLCWEEMEHITILHERCDDLYSLKVIDTIPAEIRYPVQSIPANESYGYLDVQDCDIIAYATQASEAVYLIFHNHEHKLEIKAEILRENYNNTGSRMYIAMDKRSVLPNSCEEVEAQFEVKHSFFDSLHNVLNSLPDEVVKRLLPCSEDFDGALRPEGITALNYVPREYCNILHLDQMHQDKLLPYQVALSCKSGAPPVLISGAFGTGKTCFLSSIAYCFVAEVERSHIPARVLICAHHQATADTILDTYFRPMLEHKHRPLNVKVIRITSNNYRLPLNDKWYIPTSTFKKESHKYSHVQKLVILTTFLTSLQLKELYPQGFFTHILLDEGAQAREPESVAPLCLADQKTKIIIAGDPRQVGPALLVLGKEARENGLKVSLLERLKAHYKAIGKKTEILQADLKENYRCQKVILKFASDMFYRSTVRASNVTANIHPLHGFTFPLVFVCTSIEHMTNYEQTVNRGEADILIHMLGQHLEQNEGHVTCVMSSSRSQVTVLRQLKFQHKIPRSVRVLPTYDIQGQEYDSLYISTCEPTYPNGETRNPTKSVCDLFVFNTAITRARSLIVSFGNPYLLLSIEEHMNQKYNRKGHCWSQYIMMCLRENSLIIPDSVISDRLQKKTFIDELMVCLNSVLSMGVPSETDCSVSNGKKFISPLTMSPAALKQDTFTARELQNAQPNNISSSTRTLARSHQQLLTTKPRLKKVESSQESSKEAPECVAKPSKINHPSSRQQELPPNRGFKPSKRPTDQLAIQVNGSVNALDATEFPSLQDAQQIKTSKRHKATFLPSHREVVNSTANTLNVKEYPNLKDAQQIKTSKRHKATFLPSDHEVVSTPKNTQYFQLYKEKLDTTIFDEPLRVSNYQERFHRLLCWEEKEHMSILKKRCNGRYLVSTSKQQPKYCESEHSQWLQRSNTDYIYYGTIHSINDNDEALSYAKQASEAAYILINGKTIFVEFVAYGNYSNTDGIAIGFNEKMATRSTSHFECDVIFELKHSYFHRQHEALNVLQHHVISKLIPSGKKRSNYQMKPSFCSPSLYLDNCGQMQALSAILKQDNDPVIIAGPFGTGKTRVLARATYELLMQDRHCFILICTHHQISADTFIEYFAKLQRENSYFSRVTIVRVATKYYHSRTQEMYPNYYCSPKCALSRKPQVIVCTLGLSHHLKTKGLTHIFIDEAAQTRETEAIIPLQHSEPTTKIVLAGDHFQVGPDVLVLGHEARKYGLSTSLLERLHKHYNDHGDTSHLFSLLQNYRSHSGLLMLPSSLFYRSTLQCNVSDSKAHPLAPFPLVFVCSCIENIPSANSTDTDEKEAKTLVDEVKRYIFGSWPEEWEERVHSPGEVCIMSPSANQKRLLMTKMKASRLHGVDVLKAYEIQGCEFTAVFIGTCEATDENGIPRNITKTILNHYVFNTAITRARYLVVAVGNPLQLLEKEEKLAILNPSNKNFHCWKEFIKRCIECKSFHLPRGVSKQVNNVKDFTKALYHHIYSSSESGSSGTTIYESSIPEDSILSAYKKKFKSIPECRQSKLRLTKVEGSLSWNIKDSPVTIGSDMSSDINRDHADIHCCRLNVLSFSKAEAIPLDKSKRVVHIRGMGNMKGAFHEDIVEVVVFGEPPQSLCKGRVLRVIRKCHKQILVCKPHRYNPTLFCPIDKRYPIILNLPKLSKALLEKGDRSSIDAGLISKDVVIFEPCSLSDGDIPEIKNVIPFTVAQDMLFIVRIVLWNPKYRLPLGVVIHALPQGSSAFHAERLLKLEHNVHYDDETEPSLTDTTQCAHSPTDHDINTRTFTIDPEDAVNLDDAISLVKKQGSYELAVHIVNTTKEIAFETDADKRAAAQGVSVYGVKKVMNMLPLKTRSKLSLNEHQICDVFTISGYVVVTQGNFDIKSIQVNESKIKSCMKLSYKSAQDIMDGTVVDLNPEISRCIAAYDSDEGQPHLQETLAILLRIAMKMRRDRLGDSGALSYETNDPNDQECWQMHMMVEEMMIWANRVVASELFAAFPECTLLRRQASPNTEEFAAATSAHSLVLGYSHFLSSRYDQGVMPHRKPFIVTMSTLHALFRAFQENKPALLLNLLTDDSLFPQLSTSSIQFRRIQQKAEYISSAADSDPADYRHFGLNIPAYTHFTSPLRRYADIVVQRMLKSLISTERLRYSHENIVVLCHSLNGALRNAQSFEKRMKTLILAVEYTQSSELYEAVIMKNTRTDIEVNFLNKRSKDVPEKNKRFKVSHLRSRRQTGTVSNPVDNVVYSWNIKMYSFDDQSTFPFDYEDLSFHSTVERDFTSSLNVPYISMKMFTHMESGMLKPLIHNVDSSPTAIEMSPADWKHIERFVKNPSDKTFRDLEGVLTDLATPETKSTHKFQNQSKSPIVIADVTCRLDVYDVVRVWMTWSMREAILSPQLQLIEITPFFRICLQHNAHPAECFSDSRLTNASKVHYKDLKEYVCLWEKVLLAEAAERSVTDNRSGIFYDVKLNWGRLITPETIDAAHYEPGESINFTLPSTIHEAEPFLKIHVGDLMCVRYGTKKNSTVRAVFHLVVTHKECNEILTLKSISKNNIRISERMKQLIENEKCEIQIISLSPSYQRVYKVLRSLLSPKSQVSELLKVVARGKHSQRLGKLLYTPNTEVLKIYHKTTTLWSSKKKLNQNQLKAVNLALTKRFQLIQGPPGTGKSETGAHIAYAMAMNNRMMPTQKCVLYCAPTNKAVDVVLRNLHKLSDEINILRVYGQAVESRDYPGPHCLKGFFQVFDSEYRCPQWAHKYALHYKIRTTQDQECLQLLAMEKMFSEQYINQGHIPGATLCAEWNKLVHITEKKVMNEDFDIVLCTCNEAASRRITQYMRESPKTSRLLQCIVDESGMAYEPETIVPMSLCEHVVLLGDHKQLQPVIEYKPARENGLTTSLFERYAKSGGSQLLDIQYRMHEEICRFPSNYFYEERLKTDSSVKCRSNYESKLQFWPKGPSKPITFCNFVGEEETKPGGSKLNPKEAAKVVQIARVIHQVHNVELRELALMTPYKAQKDCLKELAEDAGLSGAHGLAVVTITESQGDEYGIVILSTVRSQPLVEISNEDHVQPDRSWLLENLGFVTDEHEINVGITRSKYGLIIVGNKILLQYDDTWKALISHYMDMDCVVQSTEFPKREDLDILCL